MLRKRENKEIQKVQWKAGSSRKFSPTHVHMFNYHIHKQICVCAPTHTYTQNIHVDIDSVEWISHKTTNPYS